MTRKRLAPIHPGEVLLEEFLNPLEISQCRLATDISVPPRRINEIVHGKRAVTANTALRLARYFGTSERFWLNLQARHDREVEKDRLGNPTDSLSRRGGLIQRRPRPQVASREASGREVRVRGGLDRA
jgi:addiction module HigA family antidote